MLKIKRVYEAAEKGDGFRILIDRLWPRGLTKAGARVDLWLKEIGPSTALRSWFGHDEKKWKGFESRYFKELDGKRELIDMIAACEKKGTVTLLYSSKETRFNNAAALREYLEQALAKA